MRRRRVSEGTRWVRTRFENISVLRSKMRFDKTARNIYNGGMQCKAVDKGSAAV